MKFVVYGVEVHSSVTLPLDIPAEGICDQVLKVKFHKVHSQKEALKYQTPTAEMHGKQTQLFSNFPFSLSRIQKERTWKINIGGLFSFLWSNSSDTMDIEYQNALDMETLSFWLLHTIIPIYLVLKQSSLLLHASAVEIGGNATLFIAPSFGGKSTLADYFIGRGHRFFSDDKVRMEHKDERYLVYPSYPYRRPYREFETLGKYTEYFSDKSLLLGSIYFLNHVAPDGECSVEPLQGLRKFEVLQYAYLYEPVSMSKTEIKNLLDLVGHCALFRIDIPKDLTRLEDVYKTIIEHEKNREYAVC